MLIQLVHCLHEFQTGSYIKLAFKGQFYNFMYGEFLAIIEETGKNDYYNTKLQKLLRRIGKEEWYIYYSFILCF
jgi:hypothetical protein